MKQKITCNQIILNQIIYNVEILNLFETELQLIHTKPMIKYKLKELLIELTKFKFQTIQVLDYKKRKDCKIFHSIASDSDIDEAFKSMPEIIMTKIKNYTCKGCLSWICYKAQY